MSSIKSWFVPRFGELDLFVISLSLIVSFLLNADLPNVIPSIWNFVLQQPSMLAEDWLKTTIMYAVILLFFYVLFLPWKFAFSDEVPDPSKAKLMVAPALFVVALFSLAGATYWFLILSLSSSVLDRLMVIFPAIGIIRSVVLLIMMRFEGIEYENQFEYRNASRLQIMCAFIVVLLIGIAARFISNYPPILVFLLMYEFATLAAGFFPFGEQEGGRSSHSLSLSFRH